MRKNPEDEKLVKKGDVKVGLAEYFSESHDADKEEFVRAALASGLIVAIDKLPAEPQGKDVVSREKALSEMTTMPIGTEETPDCIQRRAVKIIKDLPAEPARKARPNEEIEAAIKWYEKSVKFDRQLCIDLLKCVLNKDQNMIDEEIFTPKEKEV